MHVPVKEDLLIDLDLPPTRSSTVSSASMSISILDEPIDVPQISKIHVIFVTAYLLLLLLGLHKFTVAVIA